MRIPVALIATAAAIALCLSAPMAGGDAAWRCVKKDDGSQNPGAGCGPYSYRPIANSDGSDTYVLNDMWNPPGAGHPQTIQAENPGDWQVVSDQARGNTAVLSYPDVQQIFTTSSDTPAPLSGFAAISSGFAQSMPSNGDNEAAYDIWMGNSESTDYAQEVMIWVDDHRTNPPPGRIVGRPSFSGVRYTVWQDPTDGNAGFHTIYMVRDRNERSGTVQVLPMLDWLLQRRLTAATGLNQIDFGWEICSTGGRPETFTISGYSIHLRCQQHGNACYSA
jgi:hypothetical protein